MRVKGGMAQLQWLGVVGTGRVPVTCRPRSREGRLEVIASPSATPTCRCRPAARRRRRSAGGSRAARGERPEVAVVSPYLRTRQTAELALAGMGIPAVVDERLRDRELGVMDLLTARGVEARLPRRPRRRRLGKFYYRPPGGESWADVLLRLRALLGDVRENPDGRVLLFGARGGRHAGALPGGGPRRAEPDGLARAIWSRTARSAAGGPAALGCADGSTRSSTAPRGHPSGASGGCQGRAGLRSGSIRASQCRNAGAHPACTWRRAACAREDVRMPIAPTTTLADGNAIPMLGLGTSPMNDAETETAVRDALQLGYRLVDTAAKYGNETGVGRGVGSSGLPRDEVFVTTKIRGSDQGYEWRWAAEGSSKRLGLDYVDLLLIHWPLPRLDRYVDTWHHDQVAVGRSRALDRRQQLRRRAPGSAAGRDFSGPGPEPDRAAPGLSAAGDARGRRRARGAD